MSALRRLAEDLIRHHEAEACHSRYAAETTAMDHPAIVISMLQAKASQHDRFAECVRCLLELSEPV